MKQLKNKLSFKYQGHLPPWDSLEYNKNSVTVTGGTENATRFTRTTFSIGDLLTYNRRSILVYRPVYGGDYQLLPLSHHFVSLADLVDNHTSLLLMSERVDYYDPLIRIQAWREDDCMKITGDCSVWDTVGVEWTPLAFSLLPVRWQGDTS